MQMPATMAGGRERGRRDQAIDTQPPEEQGEESGFVAVEGEYHMKHWLRVSLMLIRC